MNIQSCQHIPGGDTVDADSSMRPLHSQARGQMTDSRLRCVIWRLWLRHIYHSSRHGPNHHHTASRFAFHQVTSDRDRKEVCAINIDSPELPHTLDGVLDRIKILREPGRSYQMVDLAVLFDDLLNCSIDRILICHIGIVRCDFWHAAELLVFSKLTN